LSLTCSTILVAQADGCDFPRRQADGEVANKRETRLVLELVFFDRPEGRAGCQLDRLVGEIDVVHVDPNHLASEPPPWLDQALTKKQKTGMYVRNHIAR
jgi:hypothetical protein